jgi:hypothetical protein
MIGAKVETMNLPKNMNVNDIVMNAKYRPQFGRSGKYAVLESLEKVG